MWRRRRAVVAALDDKVHELIEILAIFFCDFFSCRITCVRVATHAIFATRWRHDN